jgi:hypothetical protein
MAGDRRLCREHPLSWSAAWLVSRRPREAPIKECVILLRVYGLRRAPECSDTVLAVVTATAFVMVLSTAAIVALLTALLRRPPCCLRVMKTSFHRFGFLRETQGPVVSACPESEIAASSIEADTGYVSRRRECPDIRLPQTGAARSPYRKAGDALYRRLAIYGQVDDLQDSYGYGR